MTGTSFTAACIQLRATRSVSANTEAAAGLVREAAAAGARYVQTPEQTSLMELDRRSLFGNIVAEEDDPALAAFRRLAADQGIWLHVGSLAIRVAEDKAANRAFLIAPDGTVAARYDKIHMFDVDLPGGESYRESRTYRPGRTAVVADLLGLRLGLSICYDLRFPALYRALAQAGAEVLTVPAAFTKTTGQAHWATLLRARAIENCAYVIAAAQGGRHENGRETYGHSTVIDPWGKVLFEMDDDPGFALAEISADTVREARTRIQSLDHDRAFTVGNAGQARRTAS